jgi:hypothetical protein
MGYLAPYSNLVLAVVQTSGQAFLLGSVLSHHARVGGSTLLGDTQPLALDACGGI